MSVIIFVEGGGDNQDTTARCRRAFAVYCAKVAPNSPRPKILACGGRDQACKDFLTAVRKNKSGEMYALLVDSEGTVTADSPEAHLATRDKWNFPLLHLNKAFLMVQAMEAWFLADRETLVIFYGNEFLINSLPGRPNGIESIRKQDLEPCLKHASKRTNKAEHRKAKHGFSLLALIDPVKVENASPHALEFHNFLRSL